MARANEVQRRQRREARKAVAEAKRAGRETRKLAKTLSRDARASLEAVTASAQEDVRAVFPRCIESTCARAARSGASRAPLGSIRCGNRT